MCLSPWRSGLDVKYSLMQKLQQDVNARETLAGGTHTPRGMLNGVNDALCPLKHARHEREANLSIEGLKKDSRLPARSQG